MILYISGDSERQRQATFVVDHEGRHRGGGHQRPWPRIRTEVLHGPDSGVAGDRQAALPGTDFFASFSARTLRGLSLMGFPFIRVSCKYISTTDEWTEGTEQKRSRAATQISPERSRFLPVVVPVCKKRQPLCLPLYIPRVTCEIVLIRNARTMNRVSRDTSV